MNISKPNRRSYQPHSAQATARRQLACQYNWAIHQILGASSGCNPALRIAEKMGHPNLRIECKKFRSAARAIKTLLQDPETRAAWMKQHT